MKARDILSIGRVLRRVVFELDRIGDLLWKAWRKLRGPLRHAQLVTYRSYGTREQLVVRGRVLTNRPFRPSQTDSEWRNAWYMLQRWATRVIPGTPVRTRWAGQEVSSATDQDGHFRIEIPTGGRLPENASWHEVIVDLPAFPNTPAAPAKVLVPRPQAQFGVISDIDDTIIFSAATNIFRLARITLLGTAYSRLPFKGVAAFYRGLEKGTTGSPINPFFFVSSSPWNLYDVLRDLFEHRSIPAGPLLLQDFGIDATKFIHRGHREHKLTEIRDVFDRYPQLPFLLIGDSGQEDPEIYREIVGLYPERVLAVYIRDVTDSPERDEAVRKLAAELASAGCHLLLAGNTAAAAEDALQHGWLTPGVLDEIRAEKVSEPPASPIEEALNQQT